MEFVFFLKKNINPDIRNWIVNSVMTMYGMYYLTDSFNRDLNNWIVTSVTNMDKMFYKAFLLYEYNQEVDT